VRQILSSDPADPLAHRRHRGRGRRPGRGAPAALPQPRGGARRATPAKMNGSDPPSGPSSSNTATPSTRKLGGETTTATRPSGARAARSSARRRPSPRPRSPRISSSRSRRPKSRCGRCAARPAAGEAGLHLVAYRTGPTSRVLHAAPTAATGSASPGSLPRAAGAGRGGGELGHASRPCRSRRRAPPPSRRSRPSWRSTTPCSSRATACSSSATPSSRPSCGWSSSSTSRGSARWPTLRAPRRHSRANALAAAARTARRKAGLGPEARGVTPKARTAPAASRSRRLGLERLIPRRGREGPPEEGSLRGFLLPDEQRAARLTTTSRSHHALDDAEEGRGLSYIRSSITSSMMARKPAGAALAPGWLLGTARRRPR